MCVRPVVGVDGRELRPGVRTGIGRYLLEILRAASLEGWSCVVYGNAGARLDETLPGVTSSTLDSSWTQWWDQVTLPRALARDGITVFLSPYYKGPVRAQCPVVLTIHDLYFINYPGRHRPVYEAIVTQAARLYAARATAIISDSEYSKREIVARLNAEMRKAITAPEARAKLEGGDMTILAGTPEQFAALQKEGIEQFGEIIKAAGIQPQ